MSHEKEEERRFHLASFNANVLLSVQVLLFRTIQLSASLNRISPLSFWTVFNLLNNRL